MTAVYPTIADWDDYLLGLLPTPSGRGGGGDFALALWSPLATMEAQVGAVVQGLVDLDAAAGAVLDLAGARVGEYREGLSDTEYRRIIAGRRVSVGSLGRASDVVAVAEALGGVPGEVRVGRIGTTGQALSVEMLVGFEPSGAYLARAGAVLRDAVDFAWDLEAVARTASSLIWDGSPGWDLGTWSYLLDTE